MDIWGLGCEFPMTSVDGLACGMPIASAELTRFRRLYRADSADETRLLQLAAAKRALADAGCAPGDIGGVIVVRSGLFPAYEAAWLSLLHARDLGLPETAYHLDVKGPGCAGIVPGLRLATALQATVAAPFLVLGGGASGYTRRWLPDPASPSGAVGGGVLVGDGAFAVVVGGAPRRLEIAALELFLDGEFAAAVRLDGLDQRTEPADLRRWLHASGPRGVSRVLTAALKRAGWNGSSPAFVVGTNSGYEAKSGLCDQFALGYPEARFRAALDAQIAGMTKYGQLFGGDAVANLMWILERELVRPGDLIVCIEASDMFLHSAAVLRARNPGPR
jgi:3-oxoacyl-[acyl-carrier-protein] synthase III